MSDKERLEKLAIRMSVLREQAYSKPKLSKNEQEALIKGLENVADVLSDIMSDDTFSCCIREKLAVNTRKKLYGIKKVIDTLDNIIKVSKLVVC